MRKKTGLTLMELVIAIVVAIALGAGAIVLYRDLTTDAGKAARNDLASKVSTAMTLYFADTQSTSGVTGWALVGSGGGTAYVVNATCDVVGGAAVIQDNSNSGISVKLVDSTGTTPVTACDVAAYGVKTS